MRLAALVAIALSACGAKPDGAPCSSVAGRFYSIARDELTAAKPSEDLRRAVADQLPAMRDALAEACENGRWTPQVRECMARATDHLGLEACERDLSEDQQRALDRAARGEPPPR